MKKLKLKNFKIRKKMNVSPQRVAGAFIVGFSVIQLTGLTNSLVHRLNLSASPEPVVIVEPKYAYSKCESKNEKISSENFDKELTPELIKIEKIGIELNVVSVPLANGTWKVNSGVANYAQETGLINGKSGNMGIFAHDREKEFAKIKQLSEGDIIEVFSSGHKIKYRVNSHEVLNPDNVEAFYPTDNPTLTLITCDGTFSEQRFALKAELVEIEELNCN